MNKNQDIPTYLCWEIANIRQAMGVKEKPMLEELAPNTRFTL